MNVPTVFHLVRHALHAGPPGVLLGRLPGIHLSRAGREQARELAACFAGGRASLIVAGPRERTQETAVPIARGLSLNLHVSPALDEFDPGAWQGRSFDDLAADKRWRRWNGVRSKAHAPGGENMADMAARVRSAVRNLHIRHRGREIVLVSHAEPIRALLLDAQGLSADQWNSIEISPASVTTLRFDGVHTHIQTVNRLPCCGALA